MKEDRVRRGQTVGPRLTRPRKDTHDPSPIQLHALVPHLVRPSWCNESVASIRDRAGRMKPSEDTDTPAAATSKAYVRALPENL